MLRRTRGLNERRVSFRGGRGAHNVVSRRRAVLREAVRVEVVGEDESSSVKLGPAGGGLGEGRRWLGEGVKWTRGHPVKLLAGGIGKRWSVRGGLKLGGENGNGVGYGGLSMQYGIREAKWS